MCRNHILQTRHTGTADISGMPWEKDNNHNSLLPAWDVYELSTRVSKFPGYFHNKSVKFSYSLKLCSKACWATVAPMPALFTEGFILNNCLCFWHLDWLKRIKHTEAKYSYNPQSPPQKKTKQPVQETVVLSVVEAVTSHFWGRNFSHSTASIIKSWFDTEKGIKGLNNGMISKNRCTEIVSHSFLIMLCTTEGERSKHLSFRVEHCF